MRWINSLSWTLVLIFPLTLGLAPFFPEPHVVEKLTMLFNGQLARPVDVFDLLLHGTPWIILILKISTLISKKNPIDEKH